MKRLSFRTQFKIEFFLLFTGFRKVLGKILDISQKKTVFSYLYYITFFLSL